MTDYLTNLIPLFILNGNGSAQHKRYLSQSEAALGGSPLEGWRPKSGGSTGWVADA